MFLAWSAMRSMAAIDLLLTNQWTRRESNPRPEKVPKETSTCVSGYVSPTGNAIRTLSGVTWSTTISSDFFAGPTQVAYHHQPDWAMRLRPPHPVTAQAARAGTLLKVPINMWAIFNVALRPTTACSLNLSFPVETGTGPANHLLIVTAMG